MKAKFDIALATFSWYHWYPLERVVEKTAELGYKGIDIQGNRPHLYPPDYTKEQVKKLAKVIEDHGLKCVAVTPFDGTYMWCLSTPNEPLRKDSIKHVKECIDNAHVLGAPVVESCSGAAQIVGDDTDEAWNRMVEAYLEIADYAANYDIVIGAEHKSSYRLETVPELIKLMKKTNHKNLKVLLDINHANMESHMSCEEAIELVSPWLVHMHASDSPRTEHRHLPIGEGSIDWEAVVWVLKKVGYDKWISVEMEHVEDPYAASMKSLKVFKTYM